MSRTTVHSKVIASPFNANEKGLTITLPPEKAEKFTINFEDGIEIPAENTILTKDGKLNGRSMKNGADAYKKVVENQKARNKTKSSSRKCASKKTVEQEVR